MCATGGLSTSAARESPFFLPQRGNGSKPRVGRNAAYPGLEFRSTFNPDGVAALLARHNPVGVGPFTATRTQGSRCAATLGFDTLPLWGKVRPPKSRLIDQ